MGPAMRYWVSAPVHLDGCSEGQALAETEFLEDGVQPAVAGLGCGRIARLLAADSFFEVSPAPL